MAPQKCIIRRGGWKSTQVPEDSSWNENWNWATTPMRWPSVPTAGHPHLLVEWFTTSLTETRCDHRMFVLVGSSELQPMLSPVRRWWSHWVWTSVEQWEVTQWQSHNLLSRVWRAVSVRNFQFSKMWLKFSRCHFRKLCIRWDDEVQINARLLLLDEKYAVDNKLFKRIFGRRSILVEKKKRLVCPVMLSSQGKPYWLAGTLDQQSPHKYILLSDRVVRKK